MLRKLSRRLSYANVMATLGVFIALGGSAYAIDTVRSTDIVDGEVKSVDIGNNEVGSADVKDNSLNTFDVHSFLGADVVDGSLTGADIASNSVGGADLVGGSVTGAKITDATLSGADVDNNTLTGDDINEASLNLPQNPTTATFAGVTAGPLASTFTKVASKQLPAGSWAIVATANMHSAFPIDSDVVDEFVCELRNGSGFIGGAADRRVTAEDDNVKVSLSMNGGAQVPAGGGEVSVWCATAGGGGTIDYGQMMIIRLDGFS
jgi:hypothetical protein